MQRLTPADTDRLLGIIGEAHAFDSLDTFRRGMLGVLKGAVPAEFASYNEVGETPEQVVGFAEPDLTAEQMATWMSLAHEHPVIAQLRRRPDGRPTRISDCMDRDAFRRLALYREFFAPLGIESQVSFTLPSRSPAVIGIALSRGRRDFTDAECTVLGLARPHLIQAYRNLQLQERREAVLAALEHGLGDVGEHVVVVRRDGAIEFASPEARTLLRTRLGVDPAADRLPRPFVAELSAHVRDRASEPIGLGSGEHRLLVRVIAGRGPDAPTVLLLEPGSGQLTVQALCGLGLTEREAQALRWLALGRTGPDTAQRMGISPRTVEKHLQNIYAKLGVSSRSQAAATAWAAVGADDPEGGAAP